MPYMPADPDLITVAEAADLLNCHRSTIARYVAAGTLEATKLPGRTGAYLFDRAAVEALAAERAA